MKTKYNAIYVIRLVSYRQTRIQTKNNVKLPQSRIVVLYASAVAVISVCVCVCVYRRYSVKSKSRWGANTGDRRSIIEVELLINSVRRVLYGVKRRLAVKGFCRWFFFFFFEGGRGKGVILETPYSELVAWANRPDWTYGPFGPSVTGWWGSLMKVFVYPIVWGTFSVAAAASYHLPTKSPRSSSPSAPGVRPARWTSVPTRSL